MADLPGHSVAITSVCAMKLERFDEIGIRGKRNFANERLEIVFSVFGRNNYFLTKLDGQILGEKLRY